MLGGFIATQSTFSISYSITGKDLGSSGFLGAIAAGFAAGYIIKGLAYAFKWMPKSAEGLKPMLVYPVLGFLCIGVSMYLLNTPFAYINMGVSNGLSWLGEHQLTLSQINAKYLLLSLNISNFQISCSIEFAVA
jgi:PTS system fructose-specific IIC component